ncbi:MAG: lipid-A-disaccharide synthase [Cyanobacteria bacterium]|nr:lipid-A-disaccharide synthase [Cyanobacteriota bacterium]
MMTDGIESNESSKDTSLLVIVGDVSADRNMAGVIRDLKKQSPELKIWGVGGSRMEEEGVELLYNLKDFTTFGIVEVLKFLPVLARVKKNILAEIETRRPNMVLLVDYGGFNLRMAKEIKLRFPELPIFYFISPQVWASRPWRIKTIEKTISKILVIFPFEEPLYIKHGVKARFVGHPLLKLIPNDSELMNREEFARSKKMNPQGEIVAILPGSRPEEIRVHLGLLLQAVEELVEARPYLQFIVSKANESLGEMIDRVIASRKSKELVGKNIFFSTSTENHHLLKTADIVWAKSGTTTLEVTLFAKPMLIFYRGNWLSFVLFMLFKTVKNVGWPNLLAGKTLIPELLQLDCRAQKLVTHTLDLLDVPGLRQEISQELANMRRQLGEGDYIDACVEEILNNIQLPCRRNP